MSPGEPDEPDLSNFLNYFISKLYYTEMNCTLFQIIQEFQGLNGIKKYRMV